MEEAPKVDLRRKIIRIGIEDLEKEPQADPRWQPHRNKIIKQGSGQMEIQFIPKI